MSAVRSNIAANIAGQAWTVLLALACTPFYIAILGVEAYGLIAFFLVVQSFLLLLDLGLGAATNREIARATHARGQETADLVASAEAWHWILGLALGGIIFAGLPVLAQWWLNPQQVAASEVSAAARAFSLLAFVQWPITFYSTGIAGLQKQVAGNVIQMPFTALASVGGVIVVWLGPQSVAALFVWQAAVGAVQVGVMRGYFWPQMRLAGLRPRRSLAAFARVWRFSLGMSGISITGVLITHLDKVILSRLLPLDVFGQYSVAGTVARGLYVLITPVFRAYFPRLSLLVARADPAAVRQCYHTASQVMAVLILPLGAVIALFPVEVLALWLRDADLARAVGPLAALLVVGTCLNGLMNVPFALQLAYGNTRIGLTINIVLVLALIPALFFAATRFGATGAAALWALTNGLYLAVGLPATHRLLLKGGLLEWASRDVLPPLLAALLVVGTARWTIPATVEGAAAFFLLAVLWILATLAAMLTSSAVRSWGLQALRSRSA